MDKNDYEIARELKQRLAEIVPLLDFRVFGSRARGGADEFSDMDVFLEVETINRDLKKRSVTSYGKWGLNIPSTSLPSFSHDTR